MTRWLSCIHGKLIVAYAWKCGNCAQRCTANCRRMAIRSAPNDSHFLCVSWGVYCRITVIRARLPKVKLQQTAFSVEIPSTEKSKTCSSHSYLVRISWTLRSSHKMASTTIHGKQRVVRQSVRSTAHDHCLHTTRNPPSAARTKKTTYTNSQHSEWKQQRRRR